MLINRPPHAATALLLLLPLDGCAGVWLTRRVGAALFYKLACAGMFCTGVKLL